MSSILKQYESLVFIVNLNLFSTNFYCFQLFLLNSTLSNHLFFTNNHHHILSTPSIHFLILPFPSHHISHNHPLLSLSIPLFCFISISSHLGSLTPTHLHKDSFLHYRIMTKKRILEKERNNEKESSFLFHPITQLILSTHFHDYQDTGDHCSFFPFCISFLFFSYFY